MVENYLKLFSLDKKPALKDLKKAYRRLAKQNHPDRFINGDDKKKQEKIMARINTAYQVILSEIDNTNHEKVFSESVDTKIYNDYLLYKKGIEFFNIYTGDVSIKENRILEFEIDILIEKRDILKKSKNYFLLLLQDFPDSDWAFDSEEKIKKIDKFISHLENRITDINETSPYWTEKGTPYSNRKIKSD